MDCNPPYKIDPQDLLPLDRKCQMWLEISKARSLVCELSDRIEYLEDQLKLDDQKFGVVDFDKLYESKEQEEKFW